MNETSNIRGVYPARDDLGNRVEDHSAAKPSVAMNNGDASRSNLMPRTSENHDKTLYQRSDHSRQDRWGEWWTLELAGLLLSSSCLIAVFGICFRVQNRPLQDWHSSISPNAMVSILTTLSRAGILYVIASGISQMKWIHYLQRPRHLANVDVFNDAAQSPLGALKFLLRIRHHSVIGSFASLTIIAGLAFEPMAQQVFKYQNGPIQDVSANATLPTAQIYDTRGPWYESQDAKNEGGVDLDDAFKLAILDGFFGSSNGGCALQSTRPASPKLTHGDGSPASLQLPIQCPTGNCSWPSVTSLGVCSSCNNDVSIVKTSCSSSNTLESCTYTWPSGLSTLSQATSIGWREFHTALNSTTSAIPDPLSPKYIPTDFIGEFAVIRLHDGDPLAPFSSDSSDPFNGSIPILKDGWTCSLNICAQTFDRANVSQNTFVKQVPSKSWPLVALNNQPGEWNTSNDYEIGPDPQFAPGLWLYNLTKYIAYSINETTGDQVENSTFTINAGDLANIQSYVGSIFEPASYNTPFLAPSPYLDASRMTVDLSGPFLNSTNITLMMENVATSMTNYIRQRAAGDLEGSPHAAPTSAAGIVYSSTTFIEVQWAWLSLPVVVVVFGGGVLIAAIRANNMASRPGGPGLKTPLWKGSNVALLAHGLNLQEMSSQSASYQDSEDSEAVQFHSKRAAEAWARSTKVQLKRDEDGRLRFVRVNM